MVIWNYVITCTCTSLTYHSSNSWVSGRFRWDFKNIIFNLVLLIGIFRSSYDNALIWMPRHLTHDTSTLVQVMAWCRQAASHYLSHCLPRSMSPDGLTRPQWVNSYMSQDGVIIVKQNGLSPKHFELLSMTPLRINNKEHLIKFLKKMYFKATVKRTL